MLVFVGGALQKLLVRDESWNQNVVDVHLSQWKMLILLVRFQSIEGSHCWIFNKKNMPKLNILTKMSKSGPDSINNMTSYPYVCVFST